MRRLRYVDKSIYLSLAVMTRKARGLESHCGALCACSFAYGAGGGNRTHGLGIMRPSLYH